MEKKDTAQAAPSTGESSAIPMVTLAPLANVTGNAAAAASAVANPTSTLSVQPRAGATEEHADSLLAGR